MKTNKSQKVIISILAVLIVAAGIFVGVLVYIRNIPQLKIWNAFKNTMLTAEESQAEAKYGGYDMIKGIIGGNYKISVEADNLSTGIIRDKDRHEFMLQTSGAILNHDIDVDIYADKDTSLVGYKGNYLQFDYTGAFKENLPSTAFATVLKLTAGVSKDEIKAFAGFYQSFMEVLTATSDETNDMSELYKEIAEAVLDMEAEREGKESFSVNGRDEKCTVYRITIKQEKLMDYIDRAHNMIVSAGPDVLAKVEEATGFSVDIMYNRIKTIVNETGDFTLRFAVTKYDELVCVYADGISKDNIGFKLSFLGGDYLCDKICYEQSDDKGNSIKLVKDDISEDDVIGTEYTLTNVKDGSETVRTLKYEFRDEVLSVSVDNGQEDGSYDMKIDSYDKGKYIKVTYQGAICGYENPVFYVGTVVDKINKPQGNVLDVLEAGVIDTGKFIKDSLPNLFN